MHIIYFFTFKNKRSDKTVKKIKSQRFKMLKRILYFIGLISFSSILALEPIEKLLIEKAVLPEQKKAVKAYLLKIAEDHRQMAQKYKEMANTKKGGKHKYDQKHRKDMQSLSQKFEKDAEVYEKAAEKL
ncbi:MAG: hypothetical protein H7A23_08275 [Leptospiraceae bacterium]|nr:hypothetical protein [Leptospiraceae bacterium]